MSVSSHLNINIIEYDARIRTFVPTYEEMIFVSSEVLKLVRKENPAVLDLGVGTGELAFHCQQVRPDASITGIDLDSGILELARKRFHGSTPVTLIQCDFCTVSLPTSDAIVSCIALHHIRSSSEKRDFYRRCAGALRPGGIFVSADCFPSHEDHLAMVQREAWIKHLCQTYSREEAEAHLLSWSSEDVYYPLTEELRWMQEAGLRTEVVWRKESFAVVAGFPKAT